MDVLAHANLRYLDEKLDSLQENHALSPAVLFVSISNDKNGVVIEGSSVSVDYNEWSDRVIDTANELSVRFVF